MKEKYFELKVKKKKSLFKLLNMSKKEKSQIYQNG